MFIQERRRLIYNQGSGKYSQRNDRVLLYMTLYYKCWHWGASTTTVLHKNTLNNMPLPYYE